jgi:Vacuolar-sorting associated protein 13, adaptor binding domain
VKLGDKEEDQRLLQINIQLEEATIWLRLNEVSTEHWPFLIVNESDLDVFVAQIVSDYSFTGQR